MRRVIVCFLIGEGIYENDDSDAVKCLEISGAHHSINPAATEATPDTKYPVCCATAFGKLNREFVILRRNKPC